MKGFPFIPSGLLQNLKGNVFDHALNPSLVVKHVRRGEVRFKMRKGFPLFDYGYPAYLRVLDGNVSLEIHGD